MLLLAGCKAQQNPAVTYAKDNNSLLWEVTGNGLSKPSYLFGTFHLLCKDDIKFSLQLKEAVKTVDTIYMEMKIDDPSVLVGGLFYMNMRNDTTLKDLYTAAQFNRVQKYFNDTLKMPMMLLQKVKPYMLTALLYPKMMNCPSPSGVEEELLMLAKQNKKDIKGLETIQFQSSVFDSIPYKLQANELLKNLDSLKKYKLEFNDMVTVYKKQELSKMDSLTGGDEITEKYQDILLNNRNKNWVNQLKSIMKNESVLVAVGAGHLPGNNGLIALLKKDGFTVKPLMNK